MNKINKRIERNVDDLDKFKEEFNDFLKNSKISAEILSQMELSVYEVIINVIDHTITENSNEKINVICEIYDKNINCQINYSGEMFDITKTKMPDIKKHFKEGKNRGLGVFIIRSLIDEINYSYDNNQNTVLLKKNL